MTSSEPAYEVETASQYTVVTLEPKLANEQWGDIHEVGNQLVERLGELKTETVVVDLSSMEYIGSSTVALVVRLWKKVQEREGGLAVVNKHPVVREVLQIAGLHKVWTIADSREQALAELGIKQQSKGGGLLLCAAIVAAVTGVAGLVMKLSPGLSVAPELVDALLFGGAGVGTLLAIASTIKESGGRRIIAVLAMLTCIGVGIAGLLQNSA